MSLENSWARPQQKWPGTHFEDYRELGSFSRFTIALDALDLVRGHIAHCVAPFPPTGRLNALPDLTPEA